MLPYFSAECGMGCDYTFVLLCEHTEFACFGMDAWTSNYCSGYCCCESNMGEGNLKSFMRGMFTLLHLTLD